MNKRDILREEVRDTWVKHQAALNALEKFDGGYTPVSEKQIDEAIERRYYHEM
tara:strand:+ start:619 stop:777 length:159 start_codon:yes stop_codon:yes gene_type:complete